MMGEKEFKFDEGRDEREPKKGKGMGNYSCG